LKKRTKKLWLFGVRADPVVSGGGQGQVGKVFWFFFSKKNRFLPAAPQGQDQPRTQGAPMLRMMTGRGAPIALETDRASGDLATHALWIDLCDPTEAERTEVARATGLPVPDRLAVAEIETSSRLVDQSGVLTLSTPMVSRDEAGELVVAPIGFVVAADRLLTLRYAGSVVFDRFAAHFRLDGEHRSGMQPFLGLLEALVDRLADVLEQLGAELDTVSAALFDRGTGGAPSRRRDAFLQRTLADIGRRGAHVSQLRDGLLGVGRIVRFVAEAASGWLAESEQRRLKVLDRDIASLADYDTQLTNKIQFLLDATLGFINIEQNNTIKVLTVVSIVGIPPTFIASMYGMNFKNMPELSWTYGYEYGLGLIALSIVVPLMIFWKRGWL
jgi:magnesium transporter